MTVPAFKITNYNEPVEEVRHQRASNNTHENEITRNIETCISNLEKNKLSIANDYSTEYLALAFSFASLGEVGRDFFHRVCALCTEKYNYKDVEDQFTNALKTGRGSYSIATFFEMCKAVGVNYFIRESHINSGSVTNATREEKKEEGLLEKLKAYSFDSSINVPDPIPYIKIGSNIVASPGNVIGFKGSSKSGKSGILSALIGGCLAIVGAITDVLGFWVKPNNEGKLVLHLDTEQSKSNFWKLNRSILLRTGRDKEPDWYKSFFLREFQKDERKKALEVLMEHYSKIFGGVHMVFVDGSADMIKSVLDDEAAGDIVDYFGRLAVKYDCPIITCLHLNPGSKEKGRGHLDSETERKCESYFIVTKDKDTEISTIEAAQARNAGRLPIIEFKYDLEKKYHVFCGEKKRDAEGELRDLAKNCFHSPGLELSNKELANIIEEITGLKPRTIQSRITAMRKAGVVTISNQKYRLNEG